MGSWKMRRAQFPVALLLLCVLSCAAEQNPFKYDARVSIIALIAAPAQYSGRHVRTEGYASLVDGNSALFLTSEHARERSLLNGVALVFVESEISEADLGRLSEKRIIVMGSSMARQTAMICAGVLLILQESFRWRRHHHPEPAFGTVVPRCNR